MTTPVLVQARCRTCLELVDAKPISESAAVVKVHTEPHGDARCTGSNTTVPLPKGKA